ncbi:MAG: hypothetical protein GY816_16255 [Cytophagales bacterium]|nr:hypothetical protein [Cytophagales bacterium]
MQTHVASTSTGVNINELKDVDFVDKFTDNAALNGILVTIQAVRYPPSIR